MIEKNFVSKSNIVNSRKASLGKIENINLLNEINLLEIFSVEEVDKLHQESLFLETIDEKNDFSELKNGDKKNVRKKKLISFDRMSLILKLIQLSIDKLKVYKENTAAKGLEWYKKININYLKII